MIDSYWSAHLHKHSPLTTQRSLETSGEWSQNHHAGGFRECGHRTLGPWNVERCWKVTWARELCTFSRHQHSWLLWRHKTWALIRYNDARVGENARNSASISPLPIAFLKKIFTYLLIWKSEGQRGTFLSATSFSKWLQQPQLSQIKVRSPNLQLDLTLRWQKPKDSQDSLTGSWILSSVPGFDPDNLKWIASV